MRRICRPWLVAALCGLNGSPVLAQEAPPAPPAAAPPAAAVTAAAATVNGQAIPEAAVQRGLRRVPPARHAEARAEILSVLIDNALIDQYLARVPVAADPKEIDGRLAEIRAEIKKQNKEMDQLLKELGLGAAEGRGEMWGGAQPGDKELRQMFAANPSMFDGSLVRVRHILLMPPPGNAAAAEAARAQLLALRKQVEDQAAAALAKLPAGADNLARERERAKLTEETFAKLAREHSACPSGKAKGGDVGWFARAGDMVEPFAAAAFALKPYHMSDVVATQFGQHLILCVETKPGKETKFEEVQDFVKEVYADRLRDNLLAQLRATAKVVVPPPPAPAARP